MKVWLAVSFQVFRFDMENEKKKLHFNHSESLVIVRLHLWQCWQGIDIVFSVFL